MSKTLLDTVDDGWPLAWVSNPFPFQAWVLQFSESTSMERRPVLNAKPSHGHDGLSTEILKAINIDISPCLTILINQSLATGIFPDKLKIAKIIPKHKQNDDTLFDNYRPISILPTMSKLYERVIFEQLTSYFNLTICFIEVNMALEKNIIQNSKLLN